MWSLKWRRCLESGTDCGFTGTGDLQNADADLSSLQDNGGPTWTHALAPGSPAIDRGDPAFTPSPAYDQRGPGFPRGDKTIAFCDSPTDIPDPKVMPKAKRREFSAEYKHRILEEADICAEPGQIGALLRREGLYSSHLTTWRRQREPGEVDFLAR